MTQIAFAVVIWSIVPIFFSEPSQLSITNSGMSDMDNQVIAYTQKLETTFKHGFETLLLATGFKLKLFDHLGDDTVPRTSIEIAELAGLKERYMREWLNGMVAAQFVMCDPSGHKYWMTNAAKQALKNTPGQITSALTIPWTVIIKVFDQICECFHPDGPMGLPYSAYGDGIHTAIGDFYDHWRDIALIQHIVPSIPDLHEKLERGITSLDLGCGTGTVSLMLGSRFPQSQVYGVDLFQHVIDANTKRADEKGLSNVHFVVADAKYLPSDWSCKFDYITAFDVVHDLALKEIVRVLKMGARFSMFDLNVSSNAYENIGDQKASVFYAISLLHCMTVSLSFPNGLGLGIMMGWEKAIGLLKEAGFDNVQVVDQSWDQYKLNAQFLCMKEGM